MDRAIEDAEDADAGGTQMEPKWNPATPQTIYVSMLEFRLGPGIRKPNGTGRVLGKR